ncbi:MAG: tetratricopeptide repeat protein [Deltaproteobacteria bacterium]|nr:MAG: tetratricopeptide repeat protein [Deltaproteobacteria bacterium]
MLPSFLAELQRRRVFRALVGYAIAAFAVLQIIEPLMHGLHWPDAVLSYVVVGLAAGFPIVVGLAWIFDVNAGRIERTAPGQLRGAPAFALIAAIGVLAAAPGLAWYFLLRRPPQTSATAEQAPSIAVLPLVNLSSDKEQEYFSDGLSEELLNLLAKVPGLRVAARTSAFAFKGKSEDVRDIAQKLHVSTVLEGSVRKAGDQIRITTQLVNAADGYHLWSETYDRRLIDVFAVQDEIAQAVVAALKLKLLQPPTSKERRTVNIDAFNEYLLGRQFYHRNNVEDFRRAKQAFEKAVTLDPDYAPAWAGLALATFWVADSAESVAAIAAGQDRAVAAAEKAIALAPELPDGYLARGFVRVPIQWDFEGSRADLERALRLKPDDPDALHNYANLICRALGRFPEGIAAARRATELDPLNARFWVTLGALLSLSGQLDLAREAYNRSLEISPNQSFTPYALGITFLLEGKPAAAKEIFTRSTNEVFKLAGAALAEHDLGHSAESQRVLDELIAKDAHGAAYQIGQVYAWRGETARALEWLERARTQRDGGLVILKVDPLLRKVKGDPRYRALLKKINLPVD